MVFSQSLPINSGRVHWNRPQSLPPLSFPFRSS